MSTVPGPSVVRAALVMRVVVTCLLALPACPDPGSAAEGEGEGEGDPAGPITPVNVPCALDEACAEGLVCDRSSGACVPGLDCTANPGACAFCGDPTVIPPLDCGFAEGPAACDVEAGVCRRQRFACEPCTSDTQCAAAESGLASACAGGFCAPGCGACPLGFVCDDGGCVPLEGSAVCAGAITCRDGESCPAGQRCTPLGVCLAVCEADADCAFGEVCEQALGPREGQCVQGCVLGDTRTEDGVAKVCHADGRFRPPCPGEACPVGTACDDDGVCKRTGCVDDSDCPLIRTFCDADSGQCVDGCNDPSDCGAFEVCDFTDGVGACEPEGCSGKDLSCELGQWCCGAEAFSDPTTCPAAVDDGQCFTAPEPWCRTCAGDADCADIDAFGLASHCYELQDAEGASLGKFCSVGCVDNGDCPRGVDCLLDLPTPTEGETTQGCLDALCPLIAQTR